MNENEARGEFIHEYLGNTPHLFSLDCGNTISIVGNGKEVLLMWAMLSQKLCEQTGANNIEELNKMALLAAIDHLGDLLKGLANREED